MIETSALTGTAFDQPNFYYEVAGRRTFSKPEAIMWAQGKLEDVRFFYLDDVWEQVDWKHRPTRLLDQVVDDRVRQIRSQFDHVYLSYSGGYDSHTILDAFIRTGIRLDGVKIRLKRFCQTDENMQAVEQAKKIKASLMPHLDISIVWLEVEPFIDFYLKNRDDWITKLGWFEQHFTKSSMQFNQMYNRDYQVVLDQHARQSHCLLFGSEKPRLWIENGAWYSSMIDSATEWLLNCTLEPFWTSRNMPDLHVCQVWGMLDWIESQPFTDVEQVHTFLHQVQSHRAGWDVYRDWNISIGRTPVWNKYSYQGGSTKGYDAFDPTTRADSTVVVDHATRSAQDAHRIWLGQINEFRSQYEHAFNKDKQLNGIWSKKHYIKPVEPGRLCPAKSQLLL